MDLKAPNPRANELDSDRPVADGSRRNASEAAVTGPVTVEIVRPSESPASARPAASARPRLLVVHPNRHVADVLCSILFPLGLECDHAASEPEFVRRVGQPYSLLLVAVEPSDSDALELLAYSRRKQPWLPVIMMLTAPDAGWANEAMRLGAEAVLNYPCPPVVLREVVSDALRATRTGVSFKAPSEEVAERAPDDLSDDIGAETPGPGEMEGQEAARAIAQANRLAGGPHAHAPKHRESSGLGPLKEDLEAYERYLILKTLWELGWNRGEAAKSLEIDRTTLYHKMKKYGLL